MKHFKTACLLLTAAFIFSFSSVKAQTANKELNKTSVMKTYLIERDLPGAAQISPADLKGISQKSCAVLKEMGSGIQWIHSYVTGNKIYCVYKAENEALIREHGKKGGFPVTSITEITTTISPLTATE